MSSLTMEDRFKVGKVFQDVNEVKLAASEYNNECFTDFVITTNNKKCLVVECKQGRQWKYEGTSKKPKQHYNFLGFEASFNVYKTKDNTLKLTKANLNHNHVVSKAIHEMEKVVLNDEEKELILTLNEANIRPSQIMRELKEKNSKMLTVRRIQNLINKLSSSNSDDKKSFEEFLERVER